MALIGTNGAVQSSNSLSSPKEIIPLINQTFVKQGKQNRRKKKVFLTSSPYKNELIPKKQEKRWEWS